MCECVRERVSERLESGNIFLKNNFLEINLLNEFYMEFSQVSLIYGGLF